MATSTIMTYDLRYADNEEIMESVEAVKRLNRNDGLVGTDIPNGEFDLRCYIGDRILIQIHPAGVARVIGRDSSDIERKLEKITKKTGVRFH